MTTNECLERLKGIIEALAQRDYDNFAERVRVAKDAGMWFILDLAHELSPKEGNTFISKFDSMRNVLQDICQCIMDNTEQIDYYLDRKQYRDIQTFIKECY